MAPTSISAEINQHIEALLLLSKKDVLLRLVREAERCLKVGQLEGAAVLARVALDDNCLFHALTSDGNRANSDLLRQYRGRFVQRATDREVLTSEEIEAALAAIKNLVGDVNTTTSSSTPLPPLESVLSRVRGKYAFVRGSVDDFLKRKHEDLELES